MATFAVARAYRGTLQARTIVTDECGVAFSEGTTYMVYADETNGAYATNLCRRTRPLAAASEDVRYLDLRAAGERPAVLHGDVLRSHTAEGGKPALQALFETVEVIAQGAVRAGQS